jgi:hypothetical protein
MPISGQNRKALITVDNTKISGTHTDYWWIFTHDNLPSEMFDSDGLFPARSDGGDIRCSTDAGGTIELPIHIIQFSIDPDPANGRAYIAVKMPTLSSSLRVLYFWWNAPATTGYAVDATYGQRAVYSGTAEEAVYHLQESGNGTADEYENSVKDDHHGQGGSGDSGKVPTRVAGLLAGTYAQDFDGTNDKINCGTGTEFDVGTGPVAYECIYKSPNVSGFRTMVRNGDALGAGEIIATLDTSGNAQGYLLDTGAGSDIVTDPANTDDDAWHHFLLARDTVAGTIYLYIDGVEVDTTADSSYNCDTSGKELMIGISGDSAETNDYNGDLFLISIHLDDVDSNHAAYATTRYNNFLDNANWASAGSPEVGRVVQHRGINID